MCGNDGSLGGSRLRWGSSVQKEDVWALTAPSQQLLVQEYGRFTGQVARIRPHSRITDEKRGVKVGKAAESRPFLHLSGLGTQ